MPQDETKPPLTWGAGQRRVKDPSSFGNTPKTKAPIVTPTEKPYRAAPLSPSAQKMQRDADKALAARRKEMAAYAKEAEIVSKPPISPIKPKIRRRARGR